MNGLCPWCGCEVRSYRSTSLVAIHNEDRAPGAAMCPGSMQNIRSEADRRPTWRDAETVQASAGRMLWFGGTL